MGDDDSGGKTNPLSGMPPWVWLILAMGGGSGIGLTGFSIGSHDEEDPGDCPRRREVTIATERAEAAEASHRAMIDSLQSMAVLLGQCNEQ